MGRRSFRRQLRGRWKVLAIWLPLLGFAMLWRLAKHCDKRTDGLCERTLDSTIFFVTYLSDNALTFAILFSLIPISYWAYSFLTKEDKSTPGFKNFPEDYDKRSIRLIAKVEYILNDSLGETIKRKSSGLLGGKNSDVRQRFLVSSPMLRKGEKLLIYHNVAYGKLKLKPGKWLDIKGEYVHQTSTKKSLWRKKPTLYGLVHLTYEPKGFVKVVKQKPANLERMVVKVAERISQPMVQATKLL